MTLAHVLPYISRMLNRRTILAAPFVLYATRLPAQEVNPPNGSLAESLNGAERLRALKAVIVSHDGETLAERGYHGHSPAESTNIKSASKSIVSALVGIAISKGLLEGVGQPIAPILKADLPDSPDPRLLRVTVGNLLSMQTGMDPLSGPNYGRFVASRNWVRFALAQEFVEEPGGSMLYSTASTHLLSAILTLVGKKPTLALAQEWLEPLDGFRIGSWARDRQGIYLGGNQMAMTTRSLHTFGELYRRGGRTAEGVQLVPEAWVRTSWEQRTNSRYSGDGYGYGWFLKRIGEADVRFAWGYGGQMLYIIPELQMTVTMTSEEGAPSAANGYRDRLHDLLAAIIQSQRSA
ncbi:serine hydrolase domain-containing protein [Rhizobium rhizoryzae]|uniref:serine hydrolase domain-containing protein n=2 Tax=Rhizobium rhizoryzae TaxID=451876 RepID=UPI0028A19472|nr:serine hydrolase [Rhizobium rhizoryzae]